MCVSNKVRFRKILCIQTEPNVERGPSPSTIWGACRQTSRFVVGWLLSLAAGADAVVGKRLVGMSKCLLRAWGLILPGSSPTPLGLGAANTALPSSTPPARQTSTPHPAEPPGLLSSLRSPPCSQRFGRICTSSDLPSHSLELICHSPFVTLRLSLFVVISRHLMLRGPLPQWGQRIEEIRSDQKIRAEQTDQIRAEQSSPPSSPHKQHVCNQNAPSTIELALCKSGGNNGVG